VNIWLGISVGLREIWNHKFRSFLTMSGVILGVASLLSMFALVAGIARGMREVLQSTGGIERVQVVGKEVSEELKEMAFLSPGRSMIDVEALRRCTALIDKVDGKARLGNASVAAGAERQRITVTGALPDFAPIEQYTVAHGRSVAQLDVDRVARVAVVGATLAEELWPKLEPGEVVGKTIGINDVPFHVIGVFDQFETSEAKRERKAGISQRRDERRMARSGRKAGLRRWDPYYHKNRAVFVPLSTVFYQFKSAYKTGEDGSSWPDFSLDEVAFRIADLGRFEETIERAKLILEGTHRGIDDFGFDTREDWFDSIETTVAATRTSGGLIAGISLLVGGIGITNIMLASVSQRVREIGVRRAVGARGRDVFAQFIIESAVIGFLGGVLGLIAAFALIRLLVVVSPTENAPVIEWSALLISFGSAVLIGLLSGIYPAVKAARLDPIEALRYE
jgi:putative ABC transport system permease protein